MANSAPATLTITSTIGPGNTVTAQKFTDVVDLDVDFVKNTVKVTRQGAGGISYYDYSALGTSITWVVTGGAGGGLTTVVMS